MKTSQYILTCCAAVLLLGLGTFARADDEEAAADAKQENDEKSVWTVSFEDAKKTAATDSRDIFMEFTGSDWCPPCKAFHKNVLVKEEFLTGMPKQFVLLKLDNPRDKSKQTEDEIQQYKDLSLRYRVSGVPTVILADEKGRPYAKMVGYGGDSPAAYVEKVAEKKKSRATRDEVFAKAEKAEGLEKAKLLDEAIGVVEGDLRLVYKDTVAQIIELDADNKAGLKAEYETMVRKAEISDGIKLIMREARTDSEGALKQLDALTTELKLEGEDLQQALFMKGQMLFRSDKDASKAALEAALKLAPESKVGKKIESVLTRYFKDE